MSARTLTAAFASMLIATSAPAQIVQYTVTTLPNPSVGFSFTIGAADINNAGQAAVSIATPQGPIHPPLSHAGRFTPGVGTVNLGSLFPNGHSRAEAINGAGQVVGRTSNAQADTHAFLYTDGIGMVDIGVLPGDGVSFAHGINDAGVVVGSSRGGSITRAFRYTSASGMQDLGVPPGATTGGAVAVNNAGEIVTRWNVGGVARTFRYTDAKGYQDIGSLGETDTTGEAINALGVLVGYLQDAAGQYRAFRHTDANGLQNLGTLPGFSASFANDINASGEIVGRVADLAVGDRAVLYQDGVGLVDLNTLIDPASGWTLFEATGINDLGQIVGVGSAGAFLLTPIPEPSALLLAACAATGVVCRRYRQGRRGLIRQ